VNATTTARLTEDAEKIFRTQVWGYFSMHAAQRMQSFQFYVTLVTALVGAAIVLMKSNGTGHMWLALTFAITSLLSFIFWKLDCRTRLLIKNAETALKYLDHQHNLSDVDGLPNPLRLFDKDEAMAGYSSVGNVWNSKLSYSKCFNLIFAIFGYGSMALALRFLILS
jgi:hypothetical protein